jgi:hypothetical protein
MKNKKAKNPISAVFEFSDLGNLKAIFLNSSTEEDEKILQRGLSQLLKPQKFSYLKGLFRRIGHE